nr:flocculation protein FLO11-like [Setaria viridis]
MVVAATSSATEVPPAASSVAAAPPAAPSATMTFILESKSQLPPKRSQSGAEENLEEDKSPSARPYGISRSVGGGTAKSLAAPILPVIEEVDPQAAIEAGAATASLLAEAFQAAQVAPVPPQQLATPQAKIGVPVIPPTEATLGTSIVPFQQPSAREPMEEAGRSRALIIVESSSSDELVAPVPESRAALPPAQAEEIRFKEEQDIPNNSLFSFTVVLSDVEEVASRQVTLSSIPDDGHMTNVVDSRLPVPEDAERRQQNRLLAEKQNATPRGLVPSLAPKKALRVSSTSAGQTTTPPAASGGVAGETAEPTAEVALAAATGGVVPQPGTGQGLTPAPPSASSADPAGHGIAPGGPSTGEVIDLNDEAEEECAALTVVVETGAVAPAIATGTAMATKERESAPAATMGTAVAGEARKPAPAAVAKAAVAAEVGVPASTTMTGAGTPASVVMTKAATAAGTGTPAPVAATEMVAAADGLGRASASTTSAATATRMAAHAPGPSTRPAASGTAVPAPAAASGTVAPGAVEVASTLVSVNPVPKACSGTTLGWMSRDDPQRPLFTLDDVEEWGKWQAVQGRLANVRTALSSVMGELDDVVVPGG